MTVLIVVLLAALVGVEYAARWWLRVRGGYFVFPPGMRLRLSVDRDVFPELEPIVAFDVNDAGERGPDVPRLRRGETLYRVLIAGGSQPEGYLLDQETAWPVALGRLLANPERLRALGASTVHSGSIARSGVGSEALNVILARVLPRYPRLSAIVILVGASDMLRWLEQGAPEYPPSAVVTADVFRAHPEGPFGWKPGSLAVVEMLRRAWRRRLRPVETHHKAGRWLERARNMRAQAKVIRATMPDATPMLQHFDRHFRESIQRAQAHADRVIVVRQSWFDRLALTPEESAHMWHGGAGQAWCEEVTTYFSHEVTSKLMAVIDAHASRIASNLGVEQIDLTTILEPTLEMYYDCFHLTPAGSRIVADVVAQTIAREPAASECSPCADLRAS